MQIIPSAAAFNNSGLLLAARNYLLVGMLYVALATGVILPIQNEGGIFYAHTILILILSAFFMLGRRTASALSRSFLTILPIVLLLAISLMISGPNEFAVGKIEGVVLSTLFCALIYVKLSEYIDDVAIIRHFVFVSLAILIITLIYRVYFGFQSRDDRFFLNGPIVFGWIMGFNALLSYFLYQNGKDWKFLFLSVIFIGAMLLTGSKGPIVAAVFAVAMLSLRRINRLSTWLFVVFGALTIFASSSFVSQDNLERLSALERLWLGETSEADYGSVGTRYDAWLDSVDMFLENPIFGVGLGNWNDHAINKIDYPHNFIMEIMSETGVVGLFVFAIFFIYIVKESNIVGRVTVFYFMICLSFSGDMSYYRFMFAIPLSMILVAQHSSDRSRVIR